jgi:hypothetical protein
MADNSALPDWVTFNATTRTFSGTPPEGQINLDIIVIATDSQGTAAEAMLSLDSYRPISTTITQNLQPIGTISTAPILTQLSEAPTFAPSPTIAPPAITTEFSVQNPVMHDSSRNQQISAFIPSLPESVGFTRAEGFQIAVRPSSSVNESGLFISGIMSDQAVDSRASGFEIAVPRDLFAHTRSDVSIALTATQANNQPLPNWIQFDPVRGVFSGTPPEGFAAEVVVKLMAIDSEGRQVVTTFRIKVGEDRNAESGPRSMLPGKRSLADQLAAARFGLKPVANDPLIRHVQSLTSHRA